MPAQSVGCVVMTKVKKQSTDLLKHKLNLMSQYLVSCPETTADPTTACRSFLGSAGMDAPILLPDRLKPNEVGKQIGGAFSTSTLASFMWQAFKLQTCQTSLTVKCS